MVIRFVATFLTNVLGIRHSKDEITASFGGDHSVTKQRFGL